MFARLDWKCCAHLLFSGIDSRGGGELLFDTVGINFCILKRVFCNQDSGLNISSSFVVCLQEVCCFSIYSYALFMNFLTQEIL